MYEFAMNDPNLYYDTLGNHPHRRTREANRRKALRKSMSGLQNVEISGKAGSCKYCGPDVTENLAKLLNDALNEWATKYGRYTDNFAHYFYYWVIRWNEMFKIGPGLDYLATAYAREGKCPAGEGCERTYWICGQCVHDHFMGNIMYGYWMRLFGFSDVVTWGAGHAFQFIGQSDDGSYDGALQPDLPYDQAGYKLGGALFDVGMTGFTADTVCNVIQNMEAFQYANETGEDYSSCQKCPD